MIQLSHFYNNNNNKPSEAVQKNKKHSKQKWYSATPQRTFSDATTGFPAKWRRDRSTEIPYWWSVTTQIWVVLLIGWSKFPTRHENVGSYSQGSTTVKRFPGGYIMQQEKSIIMHYKLNDQKETTRNWYQQYLSSLIMNFKSPGSPSMWGSPTK